MKFGQIALAILLLGASLSSYAVPVIYNFTAKVNGEFEGPAQPPAITLPIFSNLIFTPNTLISGSFVYDSDTPDSIPIPSAASYIGAIADLSATAGGYEFSAPTSYGSVVSFPSGIPSPRILSFVGNLAPTTIGDWTTTNFTLYWTNFSGTTLPTTLSSGGGLTFNFLDSQGALKRQVTFGSLVMTAQAPEPGTLALFGFGGLLLVLARRQRRSA